MTGSTIGIIAADKSENGGAKSVREACGHDAPGSSVMESQHARVAQARPRAAPIIDTVLLKVASRCNINCRYCYVYNMGDTGWASQPKRMTRATLEAVVTSLADLSRSQDGGFAVVLHGGEPLLLGHVKLAFLLSALREGLPANYPISIQTNGILISDEILDACSRHRVTLGISIDGPKPVHDRFRVDHQGVGTFQRVLNGIVKLRNHPNSNRLFTGVLAVIDPASDPRETYSFFKNLGAPSVDFLYRDGDHSRLPQGKESFRSTEFGRWLSELLDIYLSDTDPIRIRLLDDMMKLLMGGSGTKEGMGTTEFGIVIIDTDGSIRKNDTLKSNYDGADLFERQWSVHSHSIESAVSTPEFAAYLALQRPSATACGACPEFHVCGGGMPVNRWRDGHGYDNPTVYCADQLRLIGHMRNRISTLVPAHRP